MINAWWDRDVRSCRLTSRAARRLALAEMNDELERRKKDASTWTSSMKVLLGSSREASQRIAIVLMMLLRPEGLFPSRRRRRELHELPSEDELSAADPSARIEPEEGSHEP